MSNKFIAILVALFVGGFTLNLSAQNSLQDLQKELTDVDLQLTELEKKQIELKKRIEDFDVMGWKFGGAGGANFNLVGSRSWFNAGDSQATLGGVISVFANNNQEKTFWNNWANLKLGYVNANLNPLKVEVPDPNNIGGTILEDGVAANWEKNVDELYLASLYGYKFSPVLAGSVLADARTSFGNFFDNAIISVGVGVTYKPNADLTVVFHPLTFRGIAAKTNSVKNAFEFKDVLSDDDGKLQMTGDFGAKVVIDYKRELLRNVMWTTNFTAFAPYNDFGNLEATWLNGFGYKFNDWLNVSFNYDFRYFKPETYSLYSQNAIAALTAGIDDDDLVKQITDDWNADNSIADIKEEVENGVQADNYSYLQRRWGLNLGFTTTFNLSKMPSLPIIGKR